jgi:hypothetical protein
MFQLFLLGLYLCMYGVFGVSVQSFEVLDDIDNEAEIIEAGERLPGIMNLQEKRLPVLRLLTPNSHIGLHGIVNLGERAQIPQDFGHLPGLMNLQEKVIPDDVISKLSVSRHPKLDVEEIII